MDKTSKGELVALAYKIASEKGIDGDKIYHTVDCEDPDWNPAQQSTVLYSFSDPRRGIVEGTQEKSYGLTMIHLPDHPDISKAQAKDPVFALTRMADEMKAGRGSQWTCYKNLYM